MDPNENLKEQLELVAEIQHIEDSRDEDGDTTENQEEQLIVAGRQLAELVTALNEWITKGGFLPDMWRRPDA